MLPGARRCQPQVGMLQPGAPPPPQMVLASAMAEDVAAAMAASEALGR